MQVLNWFSGNPSAAASIVSAIIAASVAILVFTFTQYLTRRRDRTQFLTPKLEDLYLLLNQVSENNVKFFRLVYLALPAEEVQEDFSGSDRSGGSVAGHAHHEPAAGLNKAP